MGDKISKERKILYYIGLGLTILGGLLFLSSFFSFFTVFSAPSFNMGMPSFLKRALVGMICMIGGSVLMNIGAKGAAGSGIILDPDRAREDLKPYSKAAGKMINDAASEVDALKDLKENLKSKETQQVIKVKCRECGALNDEDALFCKACGDRI